MTLDNFNFAGKKAIVRVDFNVPLNENGQITDDTRIRGALPTLKKILADGGALIIMSHMGKPKGKVNAKYSLSQIENCIQVYCNSTRKTNIYTKKQIKRIIIGKNLIIIIYSTQN